MFEKIHEHLKKKEANKTTETIIPVSLSQNPSFDLNILVQRGKDIDNIEERELFTILKKSFRLLLENIFINKDSEAEESNRLNKIKRQAIIEFNKMSLDDMRKALRLYGYKGESMSTELVESKLFEIVETDPNRFFSIWVNNKTRNTQFLIEAAIAKNVIRKSRNIYYYGTDIIGNSLEDAIAHLDDKGNQDLKLTILQETESK